MFELLEEQDKGETNNPLYFPQGLWAGVTRKVALVWESVWGNIAFLKSGNCQSLYIILILLCVFNIAWSKCLIFYVSLFFHIKLLFISLILSPGPKISLLLKMGVYNPLPWIRLSLNTPFSFVGSWFLLILLFSYSILLHPFFTTLFFKIWFCRNQAPSCFIFSVGVTS